MKIGRARSGQPCNYNYYFLCQVVHDCRNDSAALYFQYDVSIKNVFDTQVLQITDYKYQISSQERLPGTNEGKYFGLNIPGPILMIISHDCVSRHHIFCCEVMSPRVSPTRAGCFVELHQMHSSALSASFDCCSAE